jgi:hypothetical protein
MDENLVNIEKNIQSFHNSIQICCEKEIAIAQLIATIQQQKNNLDIEILQLENILTSNSSVKISIEKKVIYLFLYRVAINLLSFDFNLT